MTKEEGENEEEEDFWERLGGYLFLLGVRRIERNDLATVGIIKNQDGLDFIERSLLDEFV